MEDLMCISFDDDIDFIEDRDEVYIKIKIGNKEFGICVGDETEREYKKYTQLTDCQYSTVDVITGLKKLTKFLEASIDMNIPKSLIK